MTRSHHRTGTWVEGHYRNGSWVEGHWRSDSIVTGYETPLHESPSPAWALDEPGRTLVHRTTCWWCGERVFFFRNENGGCALFDSLGWPWPIHACWQEYRDEILTALHNELEDAGYDGAFVPPSGRSPKTGTHGSRVTIAGYVADHHGLYDSYVPTTIRSSKRSTSHPVVRVVILDENGVLYTTWIPAAVAQELNDYDVVRVRTMWMHRRRRRYLMVNSIERLGEEAESQETYRCVPTTLQCRYCRGSISEDENWGLDPDAKLECEACGDMRGHRPPKEFVRACRAIAG